MSITVTVTPQRETARISRVTNCTAITLGDLSLFFYDDPDREFPWSPGKFFTLDGFVAFLEGVRPNPVDAYRQWRRPAFFNNAAADYAEHIAAQEGDD